MRWSQTWRKARRVLARGLALFAAVALVVGLARENARYFYCPLMESVASTACCEEHADRGAAPAMESSDCCEAHRLGAVPEAAVVAPPVVPEAPMLAYLAFDSALALRAPPRIAHALAYAQRAGPPPLLPGEARSRTMVFLL